MPPRAVLQACAPFLPELERIVLRCVAEPAAAAEVLEEAVVRAGRVVPLPTGPALQRCLFRMARDVLLERRRRERVGDALAPPPARWSLSAE